MINKMGSLDQQTRQITKAKCLIDMAVSCHWDEFIIRCECHPEDARSTHPYDNPNHPTILHFLAEQQQIAPVEAFEAVAKAFPAAVTMQAPSNGSTPLHYAKYTPLAVFKLLVERCQPPTVQTLTSTLPLPPELIEEHIRPFVGNALLLRNNKGDTVLHTKFLRGFQPRKEVLQMLVHAEPKLVSLKNDCGRTAIHHAAASQLRFDGLNVLVEQFPDGLTVKDENGSTPLNLFLFGPFACRRESLSLLSGTNSAALFVPDRFNALPIDRARRKWGEESEVFITLRELMEEHQAAEEDFK